VLGRSNLKPAAAAVIGSLLKLANSGGVEAVKSNMKFPVCLPRTSELMSVTGFEEISQSLVFVFQ